MEQIKMIEAYAELEGVALTPLCDGKYWLDGVEDSSVYNPLLPNALNLVARDKHKAEIDYDSMIVSVWNNLDEHKVSFNGKWFCDCPCEAVIECILKSAGKWTE